MKVINLHIEKKQSYDDKYPNEIVGLVQIEGEHGKMEVKLSSRVVADIFSLIKTNVQKVADYNASQVSDAVENAQNDMVLLDDKSDIPLQEK